MSEEIYNRLQNSQNITATQCYQVKSALKLQESLREIFNKYPMDSEYDYKDAWSFVYDVKKLLEESQNTNKEEGLRGKK